MYQKINDEKRYVFAKKNVRGRDASVRSAHGHRIREMARTRPHCPIQTDRIWAKWRSVWGRALELALQVGPQLRKPTIDKPHLARRTMVELEKWQGWRDCCSTDSNKYGVRWKSCWWRVTYSRVWMLVLAHATLLLLLLIVEVSRIRGASYVQQTH